MRKQRRKRLLALFLALAMVFSFVPGAAAQEADAETGGLTWERVDNGEVTAPVGREAAAEPVDEPPYGGDEQVRVSIVLEGDATLARYALTGEEAADEAAMAYREDLHARQDAAAESISEEALDGEPLDVVWNLTLAANIISANVEFGQIEAIKAVDGVADVIVEQRHEIQGFPVADDPNLVISTGMTHTSEVWNNGAGYTGAGMRVAIIDTGLDIEHQSFNNDAFLYALEEDARRDGVGVYSYDLLDEMEINRALRWLNASEKMPGVTAADLYHNEKLPYCFCYVDNDLDVTHMNDTQGDHGSHVAGISAANRYLKKGRSFVPSVDEAHMVGNAPDAQVLVMKVFGNGGGAYDSDYFAAIEDAVLLGCDTVNLSLGSGSAGMTTSAEYQDILDNLTNTDTVVTISAGNNSYWAEETTTGLPYSDDMNFHTGGSPGTFTNSLCVASVDNNGNVGPGAIIVAGQAYGFTESSGYGNAPIATMDEGGTGTEYDYVMIEGIGRPEDFEGLPVSGKVALCYRGETSFFEKANAAVNAGAIAVIVCNNQPGSINMNLEGYTGTAPVVSILQADAAAIKAASTRVEENGKVWYTGKITVKGSSTVFPGTNDYETMSDFSSWGAPGDLSMKPEITAPGGNIWSLLGTSGTHDQYQSMSGTSMAAPQMAGIGALVKQYIEDQDLAARTDLTARALAQSLMMSTATPLKDADGAFYPVLQQGAGLVNTRAAVNADSYILMDPSANDSWQDGKVKAELGDDPDMDGVYTVNFSIHNLDGVEHGYTLSADVFTQALAGDSSGNVYLHTSTAPLNAEVTWTWNGASTEGGKLYDFNGDGYVNLEDGNALLDVATGKRSAASLSHQELLADFTTGGDISSYTGYEFLRKAAASGRELLVPASGSVNVSATIKLDPAEVAEMSAYCPNGFYVEAYVNAASVTTGEGALGTSHSIPVLAYCGNWTDSSMFEKGSYVEYSYGLENRVPYLYDGNDASLFRNSLIVQYAGDSGSYYYGGNPFVYEDQYLPERNALNSENGSKLSKWSFTAIRNAGASRLLVRNAQTGEIYQEALPGAVTAAFYYPNEGAWRNTGYSLNLGWGGKDAEGNALPEGTQVELSLTLAPELYVKADGSVDWSALGDGASQKMLVTIDNTAPQMVEEGSDAPSYDPKTNKLTVHAQDNQYVAAVMLFNGSGTSLLAAEPANQTEKNVPVSVDLDLRGVVGKTFYIQVADYANNAVTYKFEQTIKSDIDAYYSGYDLARGKWVSYTENGSGSATIARTSAVCAGAYAQGYVFAYDADNNFYVLDATESGVLGDLMRIAPAAGELKGASVLDMAYNKAEGEMYLLAKAGKTTRLGTADILTGEVSLLADAPFCALAVSDGGTFYGLGEDGKLYSFTVAGASVVSTAAGTVNAPVGDSNSMTWDSGKNALALSAGDGIYTVDPATAAAEKVPGAGPLVSLFTAPAASGEVIAPVNVASRVILNVSKATLVKGESGRLNAEVLPWNLEDKSVDWSSSDKSVATVDADGVVTAVGLGTATITAASHVTPAVTAECEVTVVTIDEQLQALVWDENGEVWWSSFNTGNLPNYTKRMASDVRLASATMAEDGWIYGATLDEDNTSAPSDLYRVDPETMEAEKLSTMGGGFPVADVAYSPLNPDKLLVVSQYYLLTPGLADGAAMGFNLQSMTAGAWLLGVAYLGSDVNEDGEPVDVYVLVADDGKLYVIYLYEGAQTLDYGTLGSTGFTAPLAEYFNSLVYAYGEDSDPYLFWSRYNGETENISELIAIDIDNGTGAHSLGDFGTGVWPVAGLMTEELPGLPASVSEMLRSGELQTAEAVSLETAAAEEPEDADIPEDEETVDMSVTSDSGTADVNNGRVTVKVNLDASSTNGIIEAAYNTRDLTLVSVNGKAVLNSANTSEDGKIVLAYAYKTAAAAGTTVAELVFTSRSGANTTVTLTQLEDGLTAPGTVMEVPVVMPGTSFNPGIGGGGGGGTTTPSKPGKPSEPSKPEEPSEPAEPSEPTEPSEPAEPSQPTTPDTNRFTDLTSGSWYDEYVDYVVGNGLMTGTSDSQFSPNASLTRGMLVTILHRAAGQPNASGAAAFSDVQSGEWFAPGVQWAASNGLVVGSDGAFRPNGNITRQELAVILWRYAQQMGINVGTDGETLPEFADRDEIASWAAEAMSWAYRTGILTGDGSRLAPNDGATRIQAAAMVVRFLKLADSSKNPAV